MVFSNHLQLPLLLFVSLPYQKIFPLEPQPIPGSPDFVKSASVNGFGWPALGLEHDTFNWRLHVKLIVSWCPLTLHDFSSYLVTSSVPTGRSTQPEYVSVRLCALSVISS